MKLEVRCDEVACDRVELVDYSGEPTPTPEVACSKCGGDTYVTVLACSKTVWFEDESEASAIATDVLELNAQFGTEFDDAIKRTARQLS